MTAHSQQNGTPISCVERAPRCKKTFNLFVGCMHATDFSLASCGHDLCFCIAVGNHDGISLNNTHLGVDRSCAARSRRCSRAQLGQTSCICERPSSLSKDRIEVSDPQRDLPQTFCSAQSCWHTTFLQATCAAAAAIPTPAAAVQSGTATAQKAPGCQQ